jgi:PIN domain nuclease of toxin-antitoxin system
LRLLLDTHILLWALAEPRKLPASLRTDLDASDVFVSAASIWEIAIKNSIGKIEADPREVLEAIELAGFRHLPVDGAHAAAVATLPAVHKDPFDRLLVAQAQAEHMQLVTNDSQLTAYGAVIRQI